MSILRITPEAARRHLVTHTGLARPWPTTGPEGVRSLLGALRCIQLDPLDPIGTNADLVALARVDGIGRDDVYQHLLPGHAFEHFAKERCLLPASAFPYYRATAQETPWWRSTERHRRLDDGLIADVLAEVRARGPLSLADLDDRGRVDPIDWSGWKGTGKASTMAMEVLWRRCEVVVCGRGPGGKVFDVPERALPEVAGQTASQSFERWALVERVAAAGLLSRAGGPWWSTLSGVRTSELPDALVADGTLVEVEVIGARRRYLALPEQLDAGADEPDDRMRILGPLDPVIWDRALVGLAFDFEYIWEVYKPAAQRRWGWYVVPLLHRGALVGRLQARVRDGRLDVEQVWPEPCGIDDDALQAALARHAAALGVAC